MKRKFTSAANALECFCCLS